MLLHILTTGGTIDKVYFDARSEFAVGDPQIADILRAASVSFEWRLETLLRKDSLEMSDADRRQIAEAVRRSPSRRILVTHGTDTMVETARSVAALSDVGAKTVVFVGSLSPALLKDTDAEFNIGLAVGVVQILPPGVYVAMNGRVFPAASVSKNPEKNRFEGAPLDDAA